MAGKKKQKKPKAEAPCAETEPEAETKPDESQSS
jgi:hypothetical protein